MALPLRDDVVPVPGRTTQLSSGCLRVLTESPHTLPWHAGDRAALALRPAVELSEGPRQKPVALVLTEQHPQRVGALHPASPPPNLFFGLPLLPQFVPHGPIRPPDDAVPEHPAGVLH